MAIKIDSRVSGYRGSAIRILALSDQQTGAVEFRINGALVATHSGIGIIPDGAYLSESVAVRNISATTTAKKGFWLDEFAFKLDLPSARTGVAFI